MSDTAKRRLAIDLDEIERQLQQSAPQRGGGSGNGAGAGSGDSGGQDPGGTPSGKPDPLAELARIVGQDDPFRSILSGEQAGTEPRPNDPDHDAVFGDGADETRDQPEPPPAHPAVQAQAPVGYQAPPGYQAQQGFDDWLPQDAQQELRAGEQPPAPAVGPVSPRGPNEYRNDARDDGWPQMSAPIPAPGSAYAPQHPRDWQPSQDWQQPEWREDDLYADPRRPDLSAPPVYATPHPAGQTYDGGHQGYGDYDDYGDALDDLDNAPRLRRERRGGGKAMMTIGVVLGVAVIGVASALYFVRSSGPTGDGAPPLITAESEPMRVEPANPGGVEIPDQDRQIFERSTEDETRVVDREEQPVDIGEIARSSPRVVLPPPAAIQGRDGSADPIAEVLAGTMESQPDFEAPPEISAAVAELGEPRRVRTVTVRPDGTIIRNGDDAPRETAALDTPSAFSAMADSSVPAPATERMPWETDPAEDTAEDVSTGDNAVAAADQQPEREAADDALAPLLVQDEAPAAAPEQAAQPDIADTTPEPAPAPRGPMALTGAMQIAPQAQEQEQAQAQEQEQSAPAQSPQQTASVAPAQPAATGDYVVQLGISNSEDRARAAFSQYQSRYSGIIGGADPIVRRAEVNGNTIYRVRVGPYDLSSANSVCDRIKDAGGDCFVARN